MSEVCSTYGEEKKYIQGFWWRNLKEGDHLVHLGIDGRIILKWILKKLNEVAWTELMWLAIGTIGELV
jgi:hypothetical protein